MSVVEANPEFEAPSQNGLAQAMCLVDCAKRNFGGCTFDGHSCDDRLADTYRRSAWEALSVSNGEYSRSHHEGHVAGLKLAYAKARQVCDGDHAVGMDDSAILDNVLGALAKLAGEA